jgi:hypothetical protein
MKGKINKKDFFNAKNTQNAEAGESWVQGQPRLHSMTISQTGTKSKIRIKSFLKIILRSERKYKL